ncbi:Ca-activated chloride channel family protein [Actinoalloteichus hoggarensis]|uniref:Uncharacterized protein n=1 Tax=Actinoalloteichus hoggarensis TaxID=1470176 RepID=A0A221VZ59_9PSEU|nr:VWA domain-containing protein [Actinoalloteichus hoggarensis]ASO18806.1 hypothetical protein AHOG_05765 [Actinoalloteichus hoggarensis]MBB5920039.1 Ca-activated chloride channel family protein [Actinoalloteichus hoggarensis]
MRTSRAVAVALVAATALTGCVGTPGGTAPDGTTLRVLAGSELGDMRPILDAAADATGVTVEFDFTGTLEGAQALADGEIDGRYDAIWFSSNRYLRAMPDAASRLGESVRIMSSPVLLGLSTPVAERLGWTTDPVGWREIGEAASRDEFTYGMTDPSASNSGFSALVGVSSALADTGSAVDAARIESITPELIEFFSGQTLSAGSSRWLSGAFVARATGDDPGDPVDGLINYESELLSLGADGTLPEPMTVIYPVDGVVTADYPLTLLADADDEARTAHDALAAHLRTPEVQREITATTHRRPVVPGVEPGEQFTERNLLELPFPATADAMDALLLAYFNTIRRPSRTLYVLDTSGSMAGDRIADLRTALTALTGADESALGRYRGFRNREEITLLPFQTAPGEPETFTVPETDREAELARIADAAAELRAAGGTAIYDSLLTAFSLAGASVTADPERFTSIVLMTDGENAEGRDLAEFRTAHAELPEQWRGIPVFTVPLGEGSREEMRAIATLTGGEMFEPGEGEALAEVFHEIRGYQ